MRIRRGLMPILIQIMASICLIPSLALAQATGSILASPNPVPIDAANPQLQSVTLSWEKTGTPWIQLWVSQNGGAANRMLSSPNDTGTATPGWIARGSVYRFDLHAATGADSSLQGELLDSITVTTVDDFCPNDPVKLQPGVCGCGTADTDTDLDGIADCNDGDTTPIYTPPASGGVGSAAYHQTKLPDNHIVFATTPDGRLLFVPQYKSSKSGGGKVYNYKVSVFRPEAVPLDSAKANAPMVENDVAYSPLVEMSTLDTTSERLHLAVYYDPAYSRNPYPSDASGIADANGSYETYRLIFRNKGGTLTNGVQWHFLTQNKGYITVSSPRTANAAIQSAEIGVDGNNAPISGTTLDENGASVTADGQDQIVTFGSEPLWGYEPTISGDGRLMVWQGLPHGVRTTNGVCMYSYNSDPSDFDAWSQPRGLADMYFVHGPGATNETLLPDGRRFSDAYPIAKQAWRDASGGIFEQGQWIPCAYPWLSPDSTELFFTSERIFHGPLQSAASVLGVRTNWILRHIDDAVNPMRANLASDGLIHFVYRDPGTPNQGDILDEVYREAEMEDGTKLGRTGYNRIMTNSLGLSSTMWNPFLDTDLSGLWPGRQQDHVYGILMSSERRYVEVALPEVPDSHYLISLPMNELLIHDRTKMALDVDGTDPANPGSSMLINQDRWDNRALTVVYSSSQTPDTSGNLNTGVLVDGAQFPYEYHKTQENWAAYWTKHADHWSYDSVSMRWNDTSTEPDPDPNQVPPPEPSDYHYYDFLAGETLRGVIGNAIYFRQGSSVQVNPSAETVSRFDAAPSWTAQLWFKRLTDLSDIPLFEDPGAFRIRINAAGVLWASVQTTAGIAEISGGPALQQDQWYHASLVRDGNTIRLYLDGTEVSQTTHSGTFNMGIGNHYFIVGPSSLGADTTGDAVLLIDEVALSDVARTREEIKRAALIRDDISAGGPLAVPTGLQLAKQYIPTNATSEQAVADLGKRLFFDPILSRGSNMSCGGCHDPAYRFTNDTPTGIGNEGQALARNIPTLVNRLFGAEQMHDGAAPSLEHQFFAPLSSPDELNITPEELVERLTNDATYPTLFASAYGVPDAINATSVAKAIAAYQRTLVSGDSRFDRGQLTPVEQRGLGLFFGKARCAMCHNGPNLTDEKYHNIGRVTSDIGRQAVSGRSADAKRFRTPTLRDVVHTGPYFSDGSAQTLADVIEFYDRGGDDTTNLDIAMQPLGLTAGEKYDLEQFLTSLSGNSLDLTLDGPAGQVVMIPELVKVGQSGCTPACFFLIGANYDQDVNVQLLDPIDEQMLLEYTYSGGPNTYNLALGVPVVGYSGSWDNITLSLTDATALSVYSSRGLWFQLERNGYTSRQFLMPQ